ncbi:MAG TPA: ATP-binding protein [Chryseolinea sp.]
MMILVGGLPGSGKSYFAKRLSAKLDAVWLSSDAVRKSLKASGKYALDDRMLVYKELGRLAELHHNNARDVIVDATFSLQQMRNLFVSLADKLSIPLHFIWIHANESLIKDRLQRPREDSEADFAVYQKLRDQFEPIKLSFLKIESTDDNIASMVQLAERYLKGDERK